MISKDVERQDLVTVKHKSKEENEPTSTLRLKEKDKIRLAKIGARLTLKDGDMRSMEEIVEHVIDVYEKAYKDID